MRYLFFTNTPAHVHLYKYAADRLLERGHQVLILARDYTCTVDLLDWAGLPYQIYGYCGTSKGSLLSRLPAHYLRVLRLARRFGPDLVFGMGSYAAHTGAILRTPTVLLIDSESASFDHTISTPFARTILTPDTFQKRLGESHYVFDGFKECAYLHPDIYEPDPAVRSELGLGSDEPYVLVRLNAFGSQHDVGKEGITGAQRRHLVRRLADHATVFVSDEGQDMDLTDLPARRFDLHPARMHDALAKAELLVADTQTMVTEAALLGTPAIRSNSFVGEDDMGNFLELEAEGLIFNVATFDEVLDRSTTLLSTDAVATEWKRRRDGYFAEKVDLAETVVSVAAALGDVSDITGLRRFSVAGTSQQSTAEADGD